MALVADLVTCDAAPFLAAWRYKDPGLRKRAAWERTWDLQRREDAGEAVGRIPVPPKYGSGDLASTTIWKLRGKLDVPKERFISYPGLERATDSTPVVGWAGWDHLAQAQALAELYQHRRNHEGWDDAQLLPILAGLAELLPWLRQWHNEVDFSLGQGLGDYFADYVTRLTGPGSAWRASQPGGLRRSRPGAACQPLPLVAAPVLRWRRRQTATIRRLSGVLIRDAWNLPHGGPTDDGPQGPKSVNGGQSATLPLPALTSWSGPHTGRPRQELNLRRTV